MKNKMKLGSKMFGGFALLLVLMCVAAGMGYYGLYAVRDRVDTASGVEAINRFLLVTRQNEKNYMLRGDNAAVEAVASSVKELTKQAQATKALFGEKHNQEQMDRMVALGQQYEAAFYKYVETSDILKKKMLVMNQQAQQALDQCETIRGDQKTELGRIMQTTQKQVEDLLGKVETANYMARLVMEARAVQNSLVNERSEEMKTKWEGLYIRLFTQVNSLKTRLTDKDQEKRADVIIGGIQAYEKALQGFLETGDASAFQAMDKSTDQVVGQIEGMVIDMKARLSEAQSGAEIEVAFRVDNLDSANTLVKTFLEARAAEKDFIITRGNQEALAKNQELGKKTLALADLLKGRLPDAKSKAQMDTMIQAMTDYEKEFGEYAELTARQDEAERAMVATARQVEELCGVTLTGERQRMQQEMATSEFSISGTSLVAIVVGLFLAWFITRGITRPLNRVIHGLGEGASQVSSAAGEVNNASQSLAQGASQQAAALEETSSSLEEMASMTRQNAENAGQADNMVKDSAKVIERANRSMGELKSAMERITQKSGETAKIIKTIDEIAFQTNLLALNAAVEAARAGEAGAGFAVVAGEVRSLAQRAAEAAKSTSSLIEENLKYIKEGSVLVTSTDEAFRQVAQSSAKVGELVGEIAAASSEQAQGIDQLNRAMTDMDKVTQQNAASAEQSAAASEELTAQAETMQGFVGDLVSLVGGNSSDQAAGKGKVRGLLAARRAQDPSPAGQIAYHPAEESQPADQAPKPAGKEAAPAKPKLAGAGGRKTPQAEIPLDDDFKDF